MEQSETVIEGIVPYFPDAPRKSTYLSYRACGFQVREAVELAGISESIVRHWRQTDLEFNKLDTAGLTDLRKQISTEYVNIEFLRNFRLVLKKDFDILTKSMADNGELTTQEHQYLMKLRQFYTPQQFAMMKQLSSEMTSDGFDFTKLVFEIRKEEITFTKTLEREE